jgi:NADH-quinone oxidoreductase subunit L
LLENKWYVDELYNNAIVKPLNGLGAFANSFIERSGIDALVNGVGKLVNYGGRHCVGYRVARSAPMCC